MRDEHRSLNINGTGGSGRHSQPEVGNEQEWKSSLCLSREFGEEGGLLSECGARRRVLALGETEFVNGQQGPWHQHPSRLKPYSLQRETCTGLIQSVFSWINNLLSKNTFAKPLRSLRLVMLLVLGMLSLSAHAQTITHYQQEAAENNPELKAKYQQYLSALEESPIMGTLPDPEVSFSYFIKPIETRVGPQQGRISISQMLPWFGSLKDQRSASDLRAKAAFESFQESRNRIFMQVEQTILEIYELDESIRIVEENQAILNSLVELLMFLLLDQKLL